MLTLTAMMQCAYLLLLLLSLASSLLPPPYLFPLPSFLLCFLLALVGGHLNLLVYFITNKMGHNLQFEKHNSGL